ncbi:MAG: hypothetical protein GX561_02120 [Lentisphaerae bacterium]|jgi:hypothetical protein|nr:hypothetical protein [Lentisphaerota bacterium]
MRRILLGMLGCLAVFGMEIGFTESGGISSIRSSGVRLGLSGPGGFSVWEYEVASGKMVSLLKEDFSGDESWKPSNQGRIDEKAGCERLFEDGKAFVRFGSGERYGHGWQPSMPIAVTAGSRLEIAFHGRVPNKTSSFIIYVKAYDKEGKDVTPDVGAPSGWGYSIYTKTHYIASRHLKTVNQWEQVPLDYLVPEGVHAILPVICLWRGDYADCTAFETVVKGTIKRRQVDFDKCELKSDAESKNVTLGMTSSKSQLELKAVIRGTNGRVDIEATVFDCANPPRPRALGVDFSLPVQIEGWNWHPNWREDKAIKADSAFSQVVTVGSQPVSEYPFTSVSKDGIGIALGTPFDAPGYEHRVVSKDGIVSRTAVGMLPISGKSRPAQIRLVAFSFGGTWGFRSAARQYYAHFPEGFASRTEVEREGCWLWPVAPSKLPENPGDFGLGFWEASATVGRRPAEIARAHEIGFGVYPYTEAWGMRQKIADPGPRPADDPEGCLVELQKWPEDEQAKEIWFDAPRHIAAKAALNSLPVTPEGKHPYAVDQYDSWFHWWRTNPDPRIPQPNRASICWDYTIALNDKDIDGVYLDSLSYGFASMYLNIRPEHLAVIDENLTFDANSGMPCADGMQHQVAFVKWLAGKLHKNGQKLFGNIFGIAHRFNAPLIDIFGSEVGSWGGRRPLKCVQSDAESCLKRFYAYRRPVSNLLQEGSYTKPATELTAEEVARYVEHQMLYGFYPGISTIGGEEAPGYAKWKRYFGPTRQCNRDRELFKQAVPLIRRLNKAGWEPETLLRCDSQDVLIERFGNPQGQEILFTIRNESDKTTTAKLVPDQTLQLKELIIVYGQKDAIRHGEAGWSAEVQPRRTVVVIAK